MRPLRYPEILQLLPYLKRELLGKHLSSPSLLDGKTFLFHPSGKGMKGFLISLRNECPFASFDSDVSPFSSLPSLSLETFKKVFPNPYIEDISLLNEDRIVSFEATIINRVYKEEKRFLLVELFPSRPNLLVLDEEGKILWVYRPSSLESKRPLMKGLAYSLPPQGLKEETDEMPPFDFPIYLEETKKEIEKIVLLRKKEKFSSYLKELQNKAKHAKRKIAAIESDVENAKKHLNDGEKGDAIYMHLEEIDLQSGSFECDGLKIRLDPALSLPMNASRYYQKAKKAKETIKRCKANLQNAKRELDDALAAIYELDHADEAALEKAMSTGGKGHKKTSDALFGSSSLPYEVRYKGTRIAFGRNARQNDALSFLLLTAKNHLWFHILGDKGPHVIIKSDDPSPEIIHLAAEIAVKEAKKVDGIVMMAPHKNIKKGRNEGEVIVKEYETIRVDRISPMTVELLKSAKKMAD